MYTLSPAGGNLFTPGVTAEMSLPSKGIAPHHDPARARRAQPLPRVRRARSHASRPTATCNDKFSIPFSGKWLIVIRALRNEFDEVAVQTDVDIR